MALYRALDRLTRGRTVHEAGELVSLRDLKPAQIARLEETGAVSRVQAPPLWAVPGWTLRAEKLEAAGIMDGEQFLEAAVEVIAVACDVQDTTAQAWKAEMRRWLTVPAPRRRG